MPGRVSSPVFVGRRDELGRMVAALAATREGGGRFLLIAGEAGVGKTRLVEEVSRGAREQGALVAVGRCLDLVSAAIPLAPIRGALRQLVTTLGDDRTRRLGGDLRALGLGPPNREPQTPARDPVGLGPDSNQIRFFEACTEFLRRIGREQPLWLIVEDIHWADPSTLDLLAYVASGFSEAPLLLTATFRSDELHRRHPLQPFLGEIQRAQATERIDLQRFSKEELAAQLAAILDQPAPTELVTRVHARSDGNAFYAEELILAEKSGSQLPPAMLDMLLGRVTALGDGAQRLLCVVAAGGTRVATATVAAVLEVQPALLEKDLREAVDRHLLTPVEIDGQEHLAFRHSLVQEAVYGGLLPGERSRLHSLYAAALEGDDRADASLSAELAYHWYAAHDLPRALSASIEAGHWAQANNAAASAERHYENAVELWEQVPDAVQRTGIDRIELLERTAEAASASHPPRAAALMQEAILLAEGIVEPARLGLLKERFGRYSWMAGDGYAAIDACTQAAALIPAKPPTLARARVLASLGQIQMITLKPQALATCTEAVALARLFGAGEIECHALNSLGVTNAYLGKLKLGLAQLRQSRTLALDLGLLDDVVRASTNLVDVLSNSGLLEEAADEGEKAAKFARDHGLERGTGVLDLAESALALYRLGRWDDADALLERAARESVGGVPQMMVEQRLAMLDVARGRYEAAANRIRAARPATVRAVEPQLLAPLYEAAAELALWQRRPLDARSELADVLDRLPPVPSHISRIGPVLALAVRAEADNAAVARASGDGQSVDEAAGAARPYLETMQRLHQAAEEELPNFTSQSAAWLASCRAEMSRLLGQDSAPLWASAAARLDDIPMPYPRAYALWRQAEADLAAGRGRASAGQAMTEAHQLAAKLRSSPLLSEIEVLARRAHIQLERDASPAARAVGTPSTSGPAAALGLTRRETEILQLVASGRTNREIASELYITEGTAGTHVSNILRKLGVRARTEAAAVAFRVGLLDGG